MRYYGQWVGNPNGVPENPLKCIAEVWTEWMKSYQCSRNRGFGPDGLYCKQHAKMIESGKQVWVPKERP